MSSAGLIRHRIVVTGRVQGVWFRQSCRNEAERLGIVGWVRNRPDGAVEIEAEGLPAAVASLTAWANRGPRGASVHGVTVERLDPIDEKSFAVR